MVLVTRERRRGGLGTSLLKHCIAEVRAAGAVAGLDATEQGRPIYLALGFRDLYAISRWHLDQLKERTCVAGRHHRAAFHAFRPARLATYDRPLSAMERPTVLAHLATRQPGLAFVAEAASGRIAGFVLGREGRFASSIGPVVAMMSDRSGLIARASLPPYRPSSSTCPVTSPSSELARAPGASQPARLHAHEPWASEGPRRSPPHIRARRA